MSDLDLQIPSAFGEYLAASGLIAVYFYFYLLLVVVKVSLQSLYQRNTITFNKISTMNNIIGSVIFFSLLSFVLCRISAH